MVRNKPLTGYWMLRVLADVAQAMLDAELAHWRTAERVADIWWRDDDAIDQTSELTRLRTLSIECDAPLALAVIPTHAHTALADAVENWPNVVVWQHGIAHQNLAPPEQKKTELTVAGCTDMLHLQKQLQSGCGRLRRLFGVRFQAVLVPPWNRIDSAVTEILEVLGFIGLSTFKPRVRAGSETRVWQHNAHVDLINWRAGGCFIGQRHAAELLCQHLQARRCGTVDTAETTGVLSHHLVQDDATWEFLSGLLRYAQLHPWMQVRAAAELFRL